MKLPFFSKSTEHIFESEAAVLRLGSIDALFTRLEDIQRSMSQPGFHAIGFTSGNRIRVVTDKSVTRDEVLAFLKSHDIAV